MTTVALSCQLDTSALALHQNHLKTDTQQQWWVIILYSKASQISSSQQAISELRSVTSHQIRCHIILLAAWHKRAHLKAPERIAFKQAVLVCKCLHGSAPAYLTDELCQVADVEARHRLRSSSSSSLSATSDFLLLVTEFSRSLLLLSRTFCQILSLPHLP